ncbi:DUF2783 domain-containing protein [Paenalcaligenes hominis]|uniref:DNA topoisomerase IV n=1 Tax=Paenalcaligenes hominis TaxID=643674 RepID=A0ABX0WNS3_9BURK|nr:DUF2783 domain-containing protein [Paenalcaligenes hominis]NJB64823.1 hypothetical protein [Paenalcaligenes hominis]GGE58699.1 hypothetical protein GCM10007278_03690 [Paenalcaligenes hominis]
MLNTELNITKADDFYAHLIESHEGLSTSQSHAMNAALVLILSNHVGDFELIKEAIARARRTAELSD